MDNEQAFTALDWFRFKDSECGCSVSDMDAITSLLDVFKDSDDIIPNRDYSYKDYYHHYMTYIMPELLQEPN
jgi:hypothetical protein